MNLRTYLSLSASIERAELAQKCGVSEEYLRKVSTGQEQASDELKTNIARVTGGVVAAHEV